MQSAAWVNSKSGIESLHSSTSQGGIDDSNTTCIAGAVSAPLLLLASFVFTSTSQSSHVHVLSPFWRFFFRSFISSSYSNVDMSSPRIRRWFSCLASVSISVHWSSVYCVFSPLSFAAFISCTTFESDFTPFISFTARVMSFNKSTTSDGKCDVDFLLPSSVDMDISSSSTKSSTRYVRPFVTSFSFEGTQSNAISWPGSM